MNRIRRTILAALLLALAPATGAARPADVAGWRGARWGMTEAALERVFGAALTRLPGRWRYGNAYATRALDDVRLGGAHFRAIFQMNAADGGLQQVLLEPKRQPGQDSVFRAAFDAMRASYGPPGESCVRPRAGGAPLSVTLSWRFPTTTAHLVLFDFRTRAIASDDPNVDTDPLTPYYRTRRNNPRFLPRRVLVRFHATAHAELMPPPCPAANRR